MHIDQAPEGGKFRAVAATGMDGQVGLWGSADLLGVQVDANGEIDQASATVCDGVILTTEGRKTLADGTQNKVVGGKKYTVFTVAQLTEAEAAAAPTLAAGDKIWSQADGDVDVTATPGVGAVFLGFVMADANGGASRVVLNVGLREPSAA
jgi:hypothetical protein